MSENPVEVSIVIPCLNEEKTLPIVIKKSLLAFERLKIKGEVIVADNGSTDKSVELAKKMGARVIHCSKKGYGNALRRGFEKARGKFLIMGDADDSYNFLQIEGFVDNLRKGYDFVIGSRLRGRIEKKAMPFLHRYLGTPVLSLVLNLFFGTNISDCNCGMRGITKKAFEKMNLVAGGMEFASEMVIKAGILNMKIKEIPIPFYRDKRDRPPHLNTWSDGWRHLRFMLIYAPNSVFIWPGLILFLVGTVLIFIQTNKPFIWGPIFIDIHSMILGLTFSILGLSILQMGLIIKLFSHLSAYYEKDNEIAFLEKFSLEKGIIIGGLIFLIGTVIDGHILLKWINNGFHNLSMARPAILGLYFIFIGASLVFFSLLKETMRRD